MDASHSDGDILKVTVSGYDLENEYVDELKLQYRKNGLEIGLMLKLLM